MLHLLPRQLPPLALMLDDIGRPSAAALARTFGVSETTARRWLAGEPAPRLAQAAVFWLTRWGRSEVDAAAVNDARNLAGLVSALETENAALAARCGRLAALSEGFGSANCPTWREPPAARAPLAECRPHENPGLRLLP
jgi:hypothetical protein